MCTAAWSALQPPYEEAPPSRMWRAVVGIKLSIDSVCCRPPEVRVKWKVTRVEKHPSDEQGYVKGYVVLFFELKDCEDG